MGPSINRMEIVSQRRCMKAVFGYPGVKDGEFERENEERTNIRPSKRSGVPNDLTHQQGVDRLRGPYQNSKEMDLNKLQRAGFTIIRKADYPAPRIKTTIQGTYAHGWRTLEGPFETKASRDRRFLELLQDEKTIEA